MQQSTGQNKKGERPNMYTKSYIPFRGYYSSPFSKWQGYLQNEHPVKLVSATAKKWLKRKDNERYKLNEPNKPKKVTSWIG